MNPASLSGLSRRIAIRSGEESVVCSTALLRRGFISADSCSSTMIPEAA